MPEPRCPLSGSWPVRGGSVAEKGVCTCGTRVTVRMDGKVSAHRKPKKETK